MKNDQNQFIGHNPVVSNDVWIEARKALLRKEKALTRMRDQLSAERRGLPWVKIDKQYVFDTTDGPRSLSDLFDGRTQLVIKHFMFAPGWAEGCVGCSFGADHLDAALVHLEHHDVSVACISRAPIAAIEAFKQRMGWHFRWVSSFNNDFNYDFHVSFTKEEMEKNEAFYNFETGKAQQGQEASGISVFYKDEQGDIFHTYSAYARGDEEMLTTYIVLDMTPKGRNERGPYGNLGDWVKHHDKYDSQPKVSSCCHNTDAEQTASTQVIQGNLEKIAQPISESLSVEGRL